MIQTDRDLQLRDTLFRTKGMVGLLLPTPGKVQDSPILLDAVDVNVLALFSIQNFDGNNLFVDNVKVHLWNRLIRRQGPLRYEDR